MDDLGLFLISALTIHAIPGIDRIFVINSSVQAGTRVGVFTSLGVATATLVHAVIISISLYYLFEVNSKFVNITKAMGLAYLAGIGLRLIIASFTNPSTPLVSNSRSGFRSGFSVHFFNPIALLFIISFIPQFIINQNYFIGWFIALSTMSNAIGLFINLTAAILFGRLTSLINWKEKKFSALNFISGMILLYLAVYKAVEWLN